MRTVEAVPGSSFGAVSPDVWRLADFTPADRRSWLLEPIPFETIVTNLWATARVIQADQEEADDAPGFFRASLKLAVDPQILDLWHNGIGGYRAQYLLGEKTGEAANAYAVRKLAERLATLPKDLRREDAFWNLARASLEGEHSKAWIHQGRWLRWRRLTDRLLIVKPWLAMQASANEDEAKLARWAILTPEVETRIDILGDWIDDDLKPLGRSLKVDRARQIHAFGFT